MTEKDYIGISKNYVRRWAAHINKIDKKGGCPALKAAMLKHGIDKFKFEILIICFDEDMTKLEPEYIKKYGTLAPKGYNISAGGEATYGFKGKTHDPETIKRVADMNRKRFEDPAVREQHSLRIRQAYAEQGEEYRRKISEGVKNSPKFKLARELGLVGGSQCMKNEESRKKLSMSIRKYYSENLEHHREVMANAVGKEIVQYDLHGNKLAEFISIAEAARQTKVAKEGIRLCAWKQRKSTKGFIFKFKDDVDTESP